MSYRKARRQTAAHTAAPSTAADIPLSPPERSVPEGKTLIDLAAERQASLAGGKPFSVADPGAVHEIHWKDLPGVGLPKGSTNGTIAKKGTGDARGKGHEDDDDEPIGAVGLSILYAISLTMLHFTLDVLAHNQYRQDIAWHLILRNTGIAFFPLFGIIYLLHPRSALKTTQALFAVMATVSGCYLIYAANEEPYYAVMKRAPPVGAIWIWSVVELRLELAVASLAVCGGWLWWGGWTIL